MSLRSVAPIPNIPRYRKRKRKTKRWGKDQGAGSGCTATLGAIAVSHWKILSCLLPREPSGILSAHSVVPRNVFTQLQRRNQADKYPSPHGFSIHIPRRTHSFGT